MDHKIEKSLSTQLPKEKKILHNQIEGASDIKYITAIKMPHSIAKCRSCLEEAKTYKKKKIPVEESEKKRYFTNCLTIVSDGRLQNLNVT